MWLCFKSFLVVLTTEVLWTETKDAAGHPVMPRAGSSSGRHFVCKVFGVVCGHSELLMVLVRAMAIAQSWVPLQPVFALRKKETEWIIVVCFSVFSVLCNGPGTCVPICVSALLLGILGIKKVIIVYVESICRVETLSLSGKILFHLSDYFIVQWPALKEKYPKSVYLGRIV
ncbi:Alg14 [Phodopus roborovskii]|uniref:UDP-N-acetylglucosamine transferase subunit ALG14 n=1 Tax=Phodopus roborovskii TaxID=109678 RepID=A0AAU9ZBJ9_PHORO|nr:Alg14 [Phodopus roborovskii]